MADITDLRVRIVNPPLATPHATASGVIASFPMVLLDLNTDGGPTGCAYVFPYTMVAAPAVARLLADVAPLLRGQPCAPLEIEALLRKRFRLLGAHGLVAMAMAAVDMAAWDVVCKSSGLPLFAQLGGARRASLVYAPVGMAGAEGAVREGRAGVALGFRGVKAKIGYPTLAEDLAVLRALRAALGNDITVMADYNQSFDVPEAARRCAALDNEGLAWIEEPTTAEDFAGHAAIARATRTPIQAGENWWGALEFRKAITAGATDLLMPDVMKVGGISAWLRVAALADAHGMPISNHLFPEVSAHLMAVAPTAGWFEWCDWSNPVIDEPAAIEDGRVLPGVRPGIGIAWNEDAVRAHQVH